MIKDDMELLKNARKAAEKLQNVEDALAASDKVLTEYVEEQEKALDGQSKLYAFLSGLDVFRIGLCAITSICSLIAIYIHSKGFQIACIIVQVGIILSYFITNHFEYKAMKLDAKNAEKEKNVVVKLYYSALVLAERKSLIARKAYADAYSIIEELIAENPELKDKAEAIKAKKGIDFSYLKEAEAYKKYTDEKETPQNGR